MLTRHAATQAISYPGKPGSRGYAGRQLHKHAAHEATPSRHPSRRYPDMQLPRQAQATTRTGSYQHMQAADKQPRRAVYPGMACSYPGRQLT